MSVENLTPEQRALPMPRQIDESVENLSLELARIWWDGARPQMTVRAALADHRLVGAILAEVAWHNAEKYSEQRAAERDAFLTDIRRMFNATLDQMAPGSRPEVDAQ